MWVNEISKKQVLHLAVDSSSYSEAIFTDSHDIDSAQRLLKSIGSTLMSRLKFLLRKLSWVW